VLRKIEKAKFCYSVFTRTSCTTEKCGSVAVSVDLFRS